MYNRQAAVDYAHRWAYERNPRYYDFHSIGGDCTNFISQCIHAGGAPMNHTPVTGWYYNSVNDRAPAWTGVEYLYRFLTGEHRTGPKGRAVDISQAEPGDVIQLSFLQGRFGHSLLVVDAGQNPSPNTLLVATHTYDADYRPLSSYYFQDYRCVKISV